MASILSRPRRVLAALLVLVFAVLAGMSVARASDQVGGGCQVAFPATVLDVKVELALGADLTADPSTWVWTDISTYVLHRDRITISRGRPDGWSQVGPSQASLTLDNTDGRFTRLNPVGAYFGQLKRNTPLRVQVNNGSGYVNRFTGYVSKWPPRWDMSGNDQFAPITADGIFRRLGQGDALRSPLFRSMSGVAPGDYVPHTYLPGEDGTNSTQYASAIAGMPAGVVSGGVTFATLDSLAGSQPLPSLDAGATVSQTVAAYANTGKWVSQFAYMLPSAPASETVFMQWPTPGGTVARTELSVQPNAFGSDEILWLRRYDSSGTETGNFGLIISDDDLYGKWLMTTVAHTQEGGNLRVESTTYREDGTQVGGVGDFLAAGTQAGLSGVVKFTSYVNGTGFGHHAIYIDPNFATSFGTSTDDRVNVQAMDGHAGEQAHERIERLCREEGILVSVTGTSSAAMGAQSNDTLLNLLRECESADLGVLFETLDGKIGYRCNSDRYNQAAAITLSYTSGHITEPWTPQDDDQRLKNDVTVTRPGGSSARAEDEDSISAEGRYKQPWTANAETDSQLADIASWLLHLGTVDELRYPTVGVSLHGNPSLIDAWMAADISERLDITGLPSPLPAETQQHIEGYTEVLGSKDWRVVATLSPATLFQQVGRWDTVASELKTAVNATATSFDVAVTSGPLWTADDAQDGFDWEIGGERVTVTDIAVSTITGFGATAAAHADNASVTPALSGSLAEGNLILVLAAIRNSGTGVPQAPTGYTRLAVFPTNSNVQLFTKIATASETDPTVTFTGGVAGATCSAQIVRLDGKWHDVGNILIGAASCLNASAQDITYPGLPLPSADNAIILYLGWKQDDWTSVATISGATEIGEGSTTLGSDQGIVWDYVIQTTAASIPSGVFTVTGGTSQISRGAVVALRCDYQTATVTRSVNGVVKSQVAGEPINLWTPMRWGL